MYAGQIVEEGTVAEVLASPRHPYTRGLLACVPSLAGPRRRLEPIGGAPPDPGAFPIGCRFAPRCQFVRPDCDSVVGELLSVAGNGRRSTCIHNDELPSEPVVVTR